MTLRPCREESVDFDNTKNLYIEGDNLEVLKILRETYLGKVKMIYIDPPYNTGNDFVYNDDFSMSVGDYSEVSGESDDSGNRLFLNTSSNGRFHTDWLNAIYPRLRVAKDLLTENGAIFISIDDNEYSNLKKVCDEIFGLNDLSLTFVWRRRTSSSLDRRKCSVDHEYVLMYAKKGLSVLRGLDKDYKGYSNPDNDPRGPWTPSDLTVGMNADQRPNQYYDLIDPKTGRVFKPNYNRVWTYIKETMDVLISEGRIVFPDDENKKPFKKRYKNELDSDTNPISTWMDSVGLNTEATRQLNALFGKSIFNYSKPESLIKLLVQQLTSDEDIILDFYSGSATTAHAVIDLNREDGGKRSFILVQLPEPIDPKSEAGSMGFQTICDIGKERIRKVGSNIDAINDNDVDVGFRVFKCDSSNMKDVFYSPEGIVRETLDDYLEVVKNDRGSEDLLIQVMLELGVELSSKIEQIEMGGNIVFSVDDGYLVACFDDSIDDSTVIEISKEMSGCMYAIFRSGSSMTDEMLANIEQIFKTYSPQTKIRIL
ncbi:MAG: site-specific DNA-methyltransferase [Candidatus Methanomethylophilus alvus]|nr:site-specific DNA-methyltransferase [Methanomethylophilus alvi]